MSALEIYISEEDIIGTIQQEFNAHYPHLKLQFYRNPHRAGKASPQRELLPPHLPLEMAAAFHRAGVVDISPDRTVADVESEFYHAVGLSAQVFRKSGAIWLQTTNTDYWTLQQQEEEGRQSTLQWRDESPGDFAPPDDE